MKKNLTIGWLYPELMNIYGDRGNLIVLQNRIQERGIQTKTLLLNLGFDKNQILECDILLMGGAQDKQQEAVSEDLFLKKNVLKRKINEGTPGLYICGAYQFLGNYYREANGNVIEGLGIFDLYTENTFGERLIGNMAFKSGVLNYTIIGFENHGGKTYLGKYSNPFGEVIKGFGNNGKDQTEGVHYKNSFGSYSHGPILPKNPVLADHIIEKALEIKYKTVTQLKKIDDSLEEKARLTIAKRLNIAI